MADEQQTAASEGPRNLDLLLDIPLQITVEIGRAQLTLKELLALGPGSVVELAKLAHEPLDILVNGKHVARGEAALANDKFGIRLTHIVSPQERLEGLK